MRRSSIWARFRASPKIVRLLLAQHFFEGFVPIMALYAIMFERAGGLRFEQIGLLFSIWSIAYLIAELPSGVLADYWSRRNVVIVSGIFRAVGFGIWLVWPTFAGYAIGFALWGIMIAGTSGSVESYLHNELKVSGQSKKYARYYGWVMSSHWLGTLTGYGLAAVLALQHTTLLIVLSIASSLIYPAVLLFAHESPYQKQSSYFKTLGAGVREILGSKKLRYVCYGLFAVYMIIGVLEELLPRLYADFGMNDSAVSVLLAAALVCTVVFLTRLESLVRFSLAKQMLCMAAGLAFLLIGLYFGGVGGSLLVLLFSLVFQLFRPLFMHHIQDVATGDQRATIGSIPGLASGIFGAIAYALIGKVAGYTNESFSIGSYAVLWLAIVLLLAFWGRKYHVSRRKTPASPNPPPITEPTTQF